MTYLEHARHLIMSGVLDPAITEEMLTMPINADVESGKEASMPDLIARLAFNTKVRSRVWKQLAKLLQNRMHLHEALRLLKLQAEERKSPLVKIYAHILQ